MPIPNSVSEHGFVFSCRARAIRFRQDGDEAVGGFFSQIGQLYMVHHLWGIRCFIPSFFITGTSQCITKLIVPGSKGYLKSVIRN